MAELSTKPYLIRAIYEWCIDNGYCPYIAVVVDERTAVPREFVRNGEIVLNVSAVATNRLRIGNELVEFEARFGGVARHVSIPVENVSAIFAQENGHGMAFEVPRPYAAPDADESGEGEAEEGVTAAGEGDEGADGSEAAQGLAGTDAPEGARVGAADEIGASASVADTAASGGDDAAAPRRRPAKRSRKAGASPVDDAAKSGETPDDGGAAHEPAAVRPDAAEGAAPRSRRKPTLASVPKHEGDDRAPAPRTAPRRGAPIAAVPNRSGGSTTGDRRETNAGAGAPDGDGPETTPPPPTKPRLTRVK